MYDRLRAKLPKQRSDEPATGPSPDAHSTLQGMLDNYVATPHHARPTLPMAYPGADSLKPRRR